ncbi:hypothetical protein O7634_22195 [Micromonospora sp. WMMD1120]|uniref:hypothetical protein n=1 Tax=Micromonospora sp. WMMD1120 TaxID=3016106 RepID=UPI002415C774|nr:hypothetical protein [Micromonospora sp. WMMD1120]MDG4809467.1 hypothetical protein [Micromonospora sp. WMMD1120]
MTIRMIWAGGRQDVSAEHPEDLLAELIPGYTGLPPQHRRTARIRHAEGSLTRIRQRLAAAFAPHGTAPTVLVDARHPGDPASSVLWLCTDDDERYLRSLAAVGDIFLTLGVADVPDPVVSRPAAAIR